MNICNAVIGMIQWCNANEGFTSATLAVMSIIFSAIAIVVSIKTARMPYRKSLLVNIYGLCDGHEEYDLPIIVVNTGTRPICIYSIQAKINGKTNFTMYRNEFEDKDVINSVSSQKFNLPIWQSYEEPFDLFNCEATVIITDIEGKRFVEKQKFPGRNTFNEPVSSDPHVKKPYNIPKRVKKK
jgi:hypothetical protein